MTTNQTIPMRDAPPFRILTPTLITSTATLPTPANIADEVFDLTQIGSNPIGVKFPADTAARKIVPGNSGLLNLLFYGEGADNSDFTAQVFEILKLAKEGDPSKVQYTYRAATGVLTVTLGTKVGVSGGFITDTQRYADGIANGTERGLDPNGTRVNGPGTADNGLVTLVSPDPTNSCGWAIYGKLGTATGIGFAAAEMSR